MATLKIAMLLEPHGHARPDLEAAGVRGHRWRLNAMMSKTSAQRGNWTQSTNLFLPRRK